MEDRYPGLWHTWFVRQVVAVGWPPDDRFRLDGSGSKKWGWSHARPCLLDVRPGDRIVVHLRNHRIGRIGEVVRTAVEDQDWAPTVPPSKDLPYGEQGRQIHVRWDLAKGPFSPDMVVRLPEGARFKGASLRLTMCQLDAQAFQRIERAVADEDNWESSLPQFDQERSLSDYIVTSPHRLEDGMRPYPSAKARELVFKNDHSRLDVLLLDHDDIPVVVECKQGAPRVEDIQQLRGYMRNVAKLKVGGRKSAHVRGILVHGGARKLPASVRRESLRKPRVELVQHTVAVSFARSS